MTKKKKPFFKTILITAIIAFFSIGAFIYSYFNLQSFLQYAIEAKGEIIGFQQQRKVFKPVVTFQTSEGKTVTFTANLGSEDTTRVKTGTKVRVLYHPNSPEQAILDSPWEIWFPSAMILLFGIAPLIGVLVLRAILVPRKASV